MVAVLGLGLGLLLALNTMLAQDAFSLSTLQQQKAQLAVTEETLAAQLATQEDPGRLAIRARALGLQPAGPPLFLRLDDRRVVGAGAKGGRTR